MKINERIRQSEIRVRTGIKFDLLLFLATIGFYFLGPPWLMKLFGGLTLIFFFQTALDYWNAWRLKRRLRIKEISDNDGKSGKDKGIKGVGDN